MINTNRHRAIQTYHAAVQWTNKRPITSNAQVKPININNDAKYEVLKAHDDTHKDSLSFPTGSTVAVQHEDDKE